VVVETSQIGARRLADLHARLGTYLPAAVHPTDPVAGIAAAVAQADFEVRTGVHHATEYQRSKGYRPIRQVADGIRQVVAFHTRADDRFAALVEQDERPQSLRRLPEGQKLRLVQSAPIDVVVDHGTL